MKRMIIGVAIAAVVLYVWGFLWWGLGPYPWRIWQQPVDEAAARSALKEQFPENGPYFIPAYTEDTEAAEQAYAAGPVAFVHMLHVEGRSIMDAGIMVRGFLNNVVAIVLIALVLRKAAPALPSWGRRARFVALVGLAATVLTEIGDAVWWEIDWNWKIYQAAYFMGFWMIAGIILAVFVKSEPLTNAAGG
jgi:hypothetical protein